MSEIEKMYENAGIKGEWRDYRVKNGKVYGGKNPKNRNIRLCTPRFTAEKQIKLIKWLKDNRNFHTCGNWCTTLDSTGITVEHRDNKFEQALAGLINQLFIAHDLTKEEKQQIKEILE